MIPHLSERALILAPQGRDAAVACSMLQEAGLQAHPCGNLGELVQELAIGSGFALITEEALRDTDPSALVKWIANQPEWSDFPFVLLTQRGGGLERNPAAVRHLNLLGNVTFLERPFHPTTLVSLAHSALRGRRRQYDARTRLEELNQLATDLERRVEERTHAHAAAVAQLHEAQKLETLGQLTGGVAHDFNNLLTPITGTLDLLQRKYGDNDPRSGKLIGNALLAADRAKTLVQRLLGFARRQTLQTQAIDLAVLLTGMRDLVASSIGPTIELDVAPTPNLPAGLGDPNQLELAILNLCVNARDAMPDGGRLTITAEEITTDVHRSAKLATGSYVRISVIDTGCGMSDETLAKAIEPFFSTKEIGRGTGLGLSMVHGLAAQLGGAFMLSSEVGQGTRADLYLPVAENVQPLAVPTASGPPPAASGRLSVLLVDDEDLVRLGTAEMIRDFGHSVAEASGGAEALAMMAEGLEIDAVITDYKMPRMDGAALAQKLNAAYPSIPVLVITGYTGITEDVLHLPYLAKPFTQSEIIQALISLVGSNLGVFQDTKV